MEEVSTNTPAMQNAQAQALAAATPPTPPVPPVTGVPAPPDPGLSVLNPGTISILLQALEYLIGLLRGGDKFAALAYMEDMHARALAGAVEPQEYPKYVAKPNEPHVVKVAQNAEHEAEIMSGWGVRASAVKSSKSE